MESKSTQSDDVRLKMMTILYRWCARSDLSLEDNVKDIIIQCSAHHKVSREMFTLI